MSTGLQQLIADLASARVKVVDLTQRLWPGTPVITLPPQFASSPPFAVETISKYDSRGPFCYWNLMHVGEHTGTHFDAPIHWATGKDLPNNACDTIEPQKFVGPACVLNAVQEADKDPDFLVTPDFILNWEKQHGKIQPGSWVLLRTDWSKRTTKEAFLNEDANGAHTPGWRTDASKFLAYQRDVLGVGVENVGTDAGQAGKFDPPFSNHSTMHGAGKFGLASLCNLDQLPPTGAVVIAAPLKIVEGSGSPVRAIALVSH